MGYRIVSCGKGLVAAMSVALIVTGPVSAADDSRADVLERIKPIGEVSVVGQAAPAPAEAAAPAAEAAPEAAAPAATPAAAAPAAPAAASNDPAALAQAKGCMACHQVAVKVVGPAYKDVAAKYKGTAGALDTLVAKVKAGGSGNWGQIPMPPQGATSTDEELKTIVKWVLSQ